jgi:hypothetical protein
MDADLHDPAICGRNFFDVYFQGSGYQGLSALYRQFVIDILRKSGYK